jgi:hypothetical protein
MSLLLKLYLLGYILAFAYSVHIFKDKDGRIGGSEIVIIFFVSLFSWSVLLGLWIGQNIMNRKN